MTRKQEQVLLVLAVLVALVLPIRWTVLLLGLGLLWFFRGPLRRAIASLLALARPKKPGGD